MKIKGTVLELNSDTALVMTSECDFMEIHRLEGLETGQEIVFSRRDVVRKGKLTGQITLALVACLVLFFICVPVYISFFTGTAGAAVAYVSLDINPSLELAVDDRCQVLEATAFNQDGDKLLQSVSVYGKPVAQAVAALIKAAEEMHYLSADEQDLVLVCLTPAESRNQNAELLANIGDKLADLEKPKTAKIKIVDATNIQHRDAQQMGLSAGRYALWQETAKSDQGKLEQYKNGKLTDFIAEPKGSGNVNGNEHKPDNGNGKLADVIAEPKGSGNVNGNEHKPDNGNGKLADVIAEPKGNGNINANEHKPDNGNGTPQNRKPEPESGQDAGPIIPSGSENKGAPGLKSRGQDLERENKLDKDKPDRGNNPGVNDAANSTEQQAVSNHKKSKNEENKDLDLLLQEKRSINANK